MVSTWSSRAELLVERAERLRDLERMRHGWRRDIGPGAAMLAAMFISMVASLELDFYPSRLRIAIWWTVVGLIVGWLLVVLVRRAHNSRAIDVELRTWGDLDRTRSARELPPGDIPQELLTRFDARDLPDLSAVSSQVGATSLLRIYDTRALLWPPFRAIPPWLFGLVLLLAGTLSSDGVAAGAPVATVGGVVFLAASITIWCSWLEAFRRQQQVNSGFEAQLYATRAAVLRGAAPPEPEQVPAVARVVVGLIAVVLVASLAVRIATSSALVIAVVVVILAVAGVLIAPPLVRRRVLHVVPQTADGRTVLDPPRRRVTVDLVDDAIVIRDPAGAVAAATIRLGTIVAVVDVELGYPFAPPALGIVTAEENVVLAGSGARDLRAVTAARSASTEGYRA